MNIFPPRPGHGKGGAPTRQILLQEYASLFYSVYRLKFDNIWKGKKKLHLVTSAFPSKTFLFFIIGCLIFCTNSCTIFVQLNAFFFYFFIHNFPFVTDLVNPSYHGLFLGLGNATWPSSWEWHRCVEASPTHCAVFARRPMSGMPQTFLLRSAQVSLQAHMLTWISVWA